LLDGSWLAAGLPRIGLAVDFSERDLELPYIPHLVNKVVPVFEAESSLFQAVDERRQTGSDRVPAPRREIVHHLVAKVVVRVEDRLTVRAQRRVRLRVALIELLFSCGQPAFAMHSALSTLLA